jgi:predicted ester cyclase
MAGWEVMHEISPRLQDLAERYTAAWCSQAPAKVAEFFAIDGSLTINGGRPAVGRAEIGEAARSFMTAFPDLRVTMDRLVPDGESVEYHWTLTGTNTGPGGSGRAVRISGFESWRFAEDGLIAESLGSFDSNDYARQISRSD